MITSRLDDASSPRRILCVDVELSRPAESIQVPPGYKNVQALVRLHGRPLGTVVLPVVGDRCRALDVRRAALKAFQWQVIRHLIEDRLGDGMPPEGWSVRDLPRVRHADAGRSLPTVTVAVCSRDRAQDLERCLESIMKLDLPPLEVLVVDNAPQTGATERLVRERFPTVRYVREPRPGLDWARNRVVIEAKGDVIAFTDDDCIVDPGWVRAIATLLADDPGAAAVTGLVVPFELETEAQLLFERSGGFARGYERRWWAVDRDRGLPWEYCGAGQFGTGANMAFRRDLFDQIGLFDPALDVGTVTGGGGDLDLFFRLLAEGHVLVYEPAAVVRHRHRRTYAELTRQIAGNGHGFCSFLVANATAYTNERMRFVYMAWWWFWSWQLKRQLAAMVRPTRLPRQLTAVELWSGLTGLRLYSKARRAAKKIIAGFGPQEIEHRPIRRSWIRRRRGSSWVGPIGVRTLDVQHGVGDMHGLEGYELTKLYVTWGDRLIGSVTIPNQHRPVSGRRLRETIANELGVQFLEFTREGAMGAAWNSAESTILDWYGAADSPVLQEQLPASVPVSIVIATFDRPDGLRECLRSISMQRTRRRVEVVVVDNHPASGITPPVVAEFPGVRLVTEVRKGLSFARNTGIANATGQIVITTDDDVVIPPHWLERLIAPFVRPDVVVVTGNVLPAVLETDAQVHFETYGGLGRGFKKFEVDGNWFESFNSNAAPTWELGATANAAFRASLFSESAVGMMDERLGAGMPTGCSEDSYAIYRALMADHTLVYEPAAYLWHQHRSSMRALRRQIYSYSKGHVAYHMLTLLHDHDLRSIKRLLVDLPVWRVKQVWARMRGRSTYPMSLVAVEIAGNLVGPLALLRSHIRVLRKGRGGRSSAGLAEPRRRPDDPAPAAEVERSAMLS